MRRRKGHEFFFAVWVFGERKKKKKKNSGFRITLKK